jgi:hypothetical protein
LVNLSNDKRRLRANRIGCRSIGQNAPERFGPNQNMVALRLELAASCPKIAANKIMDLCGVYYPDRIGR